MEWVGDKCLIHLKLDPNIKQNFKKPYMCLQKLISNESDEDSHIYNKIFPDFESFLDIMNWWGKA